MTNDRIFDSLADEPIELDRRLELLADLTLTGLSAAELAELDQLDGTPDQALPLRLAAAAADRALVPDKDLEVDLPERLRLRLLADAATFFSSDSGSRGNRSRWRWQSATPWLGWVAAAACLLLLVDTYRKRPQPPLERTPTTTTTTATVAPSLEERLGRIAPVKLVATDHPLAAGAGGELVWSGDRQEGYLRVRGLGEVEPSRGVYQLWIFDDTRDPRFPIDGGMFSVRDAKNATFVPIRAPLPVRRPTMFAITLEPAGGVVVSDRKRLLLTANIRE